MDDQEEVWAEEKKRCAADEARELDRKGSKPKRYKTWAEWFEKKFGQPISEVR